MKTVLFYYIAAINVLSFCMMGIDKWKAKRERWRIPERTLFLVSIFGGSIGSLIGMHLFRHKTKKLRFLIGLPIILVLQILCGLFLFLHQQEQKGRPVTAVTNELALIQNLDETTIQNFISYENMMSTPPSNAKVGKETTEAVHLFFKNFQYEILSEEIANDTASVQVKITNIDTRELAKDLCLALTARNLNLDTASHIPEIMNDYFSLLRDTLKTNDYALVSSTATFHLKKDGEFWIIQSDSELQNQLVSNFISWINNPELLTPEEVLTIYMDEFASLTAEQWLEYLSVEDIFSTGSPSYYQKVDHRYMEKIAEYFDYSINAYRIEDETAYTELTISSIDMPAVLDLYKEKLLAYAHTSDSITSDEAGLADDAARCLLEALEETSAPAAFPVTAELINDGHTWQLEITEELTNAFLGNIAGALETFNS